MQQIIGARSKDLVYDLIVLDNPDTIERDDFEVSGVEVNTEGSIPRNTHATVNASPNSILYEGNTDVYYDRLDLDDVFYGLPRRLVAATVPGSIGDALDLVTARWGLGLLAAEITPSVLDTQQYPFQFKLIPTPDNLAYIGDVEFSIRVPPKDLDVQISTKQLNGLKLPYYQSGFGQGLLYSYGLNATPYKADLAALAVGDVPTKTIADALTEMTRDDWVLATDAQPYNLQDAQVIATGETQQLHDQDYPVPLGYSHAVVVQLGPLSTALAGVLVLPYNVSNN